MTPADASKALAEALLGTPELTALDLARQSGIEPDDARRLWRALGFPPVMDDERHFTQADLQVLRAVHGLVELQHADPGDMLQVARVMGRSLARIADAQVAVVASRLDHEQAAEEAPAAAQVVARIEALAPSLESVLGYVWRRHLLAALLQLSATPSATDRVSTVGFADLVGFTAMSEALDARELTTLVDRFEAIAYEHILEHGGRVVKMIGDEVMFSVDDGRRAAEIALDLVEAHARDDALPDVRVGLAGGPVVNWEGDLFGTTVNLASRLVDLARPGTVLVSDELGEQLREQPGLELHHLRPVKLKGIGRVSSWVLRRPA